MKIRINGKSDSLENKEVRRALWYYLRRLLKPAILKTITLTVTFKEKNNAGELCPSEDPRTFFMEIASQASKRKTLMTLAHEAAHLSQYATGRLMDYKKRKHPLCKFEGKRFRFDDSDDKLYYSSPWEIEAYGQEYCLYKLYMKFGRK